MPRLLKQIIYGAFYVAVIGLIVWGAAAPKPAAPVCAENCASVPNLQSVGAPLILKTSDGRYAAVLTAVRNTSADYGTAPFYYHIALSDAAGRPLTALQGSGDIWPGAARYLLNVVSDPAIAAEAASATLAIDPPVWRAAADFLPSALSLTGGPNTSIASSGIAVTGTLKNGGAAAIANVTALAIIADKYQDPLFAGATTVSLPAYGTADITIALPYDQAIARRLDAGLTKIYIYP